MLLVYYTNTLFLFWNIHKLSFFSEHIIWHNIDVSNLFHTQQHPFCTLHDSKDTDVASFVKSILGDWDRPTLQIWRVAAGGDGTIWESTNSKTNTCKTRPPQQTTVHRSGGKNTKTEGGRAVS